MYALLYDLSNDEGYVSEIQDDGETFEVFRNKCKKYIGKVSGDYIAEIYSDDYLLIDYVVAN